MGRPGEQIREGVLDRFVSWVSPERGLRRARARAAAAVVRHYEAASYGRRTQDWARNSLDANGTTRRSLARLRDLARDLRRNNGWARRGIEVIANNTIGWGITPSAVDESKGRANRAQTAWNDWAESTSCDVDGRLSFYGIQRLSLETIVESGEALIVRRWTPGANALGFQVQVLEPDYLDHYRDQITRANGNQVIQGVEFDKAGKRVGYWLYKEHPGAQRQLRGHTSEFVSADDVLHVFRTERAGQVRGVTWLAAAIVALETLGEYEDAALMRQKIAACFAVFVSDETGSLGTIGSVNSDDTIETLEPGMVHYLRQGQKVDFASPPPETGYDSFTRSQIRRYCACLGITYEDATWDYSGVNFSSARMSRISHFANVHSWQWQIMIPQLCAPVWLWFNQAALIANALDLPVGVEWGPPPMPMIEPDREGLAYARLMRAGVMTLPEVMRERGKDYAAHIAELAASNADLDRLGIWLDSDPRRTSAAGLTQERGSSGGAKVTEAAEGQAALGGDQ